MLDREDWWFVCQWVCVCCGWAFVDQVSVYACLWCIDLLVLNQRAFMYRYRPKCTKMRISLGIPLIERLNGSFAIPLAERKFRSCLASNKIQQSRADQHAIAIWCWMLATGWKLSPTSWLRKSELHRLSFRGFQPPVCMCCGAKGQCYCDDCDSGQWWVWWRI